MLRKYAGEQSDECVFADSCRSREWQQRRRHEEYGLKQEDLRISGPALAHGKRYHEGNTEPTDYLTQTDQNDLAHGFGVSSDQFCTFLKITERPVHFLLPSLLILYRNPVDYSIEPLKKPVFQLAGEHDRQKTCNKQNVQKES